MARPLRQAKGNVVYHVLNRANGRLRIFKRAGDFLAFEQLLAEGVERFSMRQCGCPPPARPTKKVENTLTSVRYWCLTLFRSPEEIPIYKIAICLLRGLRVLRGEK